MPASVVSQFSSFQAGLRLVDGSDLASMANLQFGSTVGVTAKAGGGQALATPVSGANVQVDVCVTNSDSIQLPPAIPGTRVSVYNNTGQTLAVFGVPVNASNANAGDTIAAAASLTQQPTATGVTQLTAKAADYV